MLLAPRGAASLFMRQHCHRRVWSLSLVDHCSLVRYSFLSISVGGAAALCSLEPDDSAEVIGNYIRQLLFAVRILNELLGPGCWGILGCMARVLLLPGTGRSFPPRLTTTHTSFGPSHMCPLAFPFPVHSIPPKQNTFYWSWW